MRQQQYNQMTPQQQMQMRQQGQPTQQQQQQQQRPTQQMMQQSEPSAFAFGGGAGMFGVVSDNYSFLDQDPESLLAKGNGGMRQQHHYAGLDSNLQITTPPDNYTPDKIGATSIEQMQQQRNNDINIQKGSAQRY
jgi:hypothetical protein